MNMRRYVLPALILVSAALIMSCTQPGNDEKSGENAGSETTATSLVGTAWQHSYTGTGTSYSSGKLTANMTYEYNDRYTFGTDGTFIFTFYTKEKRTDIETEITEISVFDTNKKRYIFLYG